MAECSVNNIGGGGGSDVCTAARDKVLAGFKAITKDSNDEPVEGLIQSMPGQTVTPASYAQTVNCLGKYMTGNIAVGAVSVYKELRLNLTSSSVTEVFKSGGTVNHTMYYLQYSGNIGFTPRFIMATNNELITYHANYCLAMGKAWTADASGDLYAPYMTISGNIYANSSGFKIPIGKSSTYCRSKAWAVFLYGY